MIIEPAPPMVLPSCAPLGELNPGAPVHFSDLKRMHLSPLHYLASVAEDFDATRAMRIGTVCHHITLGESNVKPLVRYRGGDRKGDRWKKFEAQYLDANGKPTAEIVTDKEWDEGEAIAIGLARDPIAMELIEGARTEIPMAWETAGIKCATRGLDIVGPDYMADLKVTHSTEPEALMRHAERMLYPQQLAFYEDGCKASGINITRGIFLIGVEAKAPHAVTVLRVTPEVLLHGWKSVVLWTERLRSCRENNHWPAYSQKIVDWTLPHWLAPDED